MILRAIYRPILGNLSDDISNIGRFLLQMIWWTIFQYRVSSRQKRRYRLIFRLSRMIFKIGLCMNLWHGYWSRNPPTSLLENKLLPHIGNQKSIASVFHPQTLRIETHHNQQLKHHSDSTIWYNNVDNIISQYGL